MKDRAVDKPLLYTTLALLVGGFLILAFASIAVSQKNFGTLGYYIYRQLLFGGGVGLILFYLAYRVPYRIWRKLAVPLMIISFILLALLFIPEISYSAGGARRWLLFGSIGFQPSEFLKLSFIIYLASWLDTRRKEVGSISYGAVPFALMLGVVGVFLAMQPDIGTFGVILLTAVLLYFLGGGTFAHITTLVLLSGVMGYVLIQIAPYRLARILVFLNPGIDPQGIGYQINQALIAIGSGGFWGLGFGKSIQKYSYLPEPIGDSIFAIFAEETGFVGITIFLSVFIFFFWRGMIIARNAPDVFGKLLAAGISISILLQSFMNMAAISGLLPLTGIPLPFVSYGSSSLAMTLAGAGILLNISKHS